MIENLIVFTKKFKIDTDYKLNLKLNTNQNRDHERCFVSIYQMKKVSWVNERGSTNMSSQSFKVPFNVSIVSV